LIFLVFAPIFIVFGFVADYLWNLIVLVVTRRFIGVVASPQYAKRNVFMYCLFATLAGLATDLVYYFGISVPIINYLELPLWETRVIAGVSLLVPIILISLANFAMSRRYFGLTRRQAWTIGISMGVLTTPYMLIAWWP